MVAGAALYVAALVLLASAQGLLAVMLSAGVMIGASLACTGSALTMSVATRVVSPANRSLVLGMVSAVGSLGAMIAAPIGQTLAARARLALGCVPVLRCCRIGDAAGGLGGRPGRQGAAARPGGRHGRRRNGDAGGAPGPCTACPSW